MKKNRMIHISYESAKRLMLEFLECDILSTDEEVLNKLRDILNKYGNFGFPQQPLGRIRIDKSCRIFLPDYSMEEVKMSYLPKTVFLFYLLHPEGVEYKKAYRYLAEIYSIYQEVAIDKNYEAGKIKSRLHNLVSLDNNRMYEACCSAKRSLKPFTGEERIDFYCVSGQRDKLRGIPLDRRLVFIENDKLRQIISESGNNSFPNCVEG